MQMLPQSEDLADWAVFQRSSNSADLEKPIRSHIAHYIVDVLRKVNALILSLTTVLNQQIVGHIATSAIRIPSGLD